MSLLKASQIAVAFRNAGGADQPNLIGIANRISLDSSNLPFLGDAKERFMASTDAAKSAIDQGVAPRPEDQAAAVNALLFFYSNIFSATVNKQEELIGKGKTKFVTLEDLALDLTPVKDALAESKGVASVSQARTYFDNMIGYAGRNKANRATAADMLVKKGQAQEAAAVAPPPTGGADAAVNNVAKDAGVGSSGSGSASMLPKVILAVAVVGGVLWYMRQRR